MTALLVSLVAVLCEIPAQAESPNGWRTYRSHTASYAVRYPRSWHAQTMAPEAGVVFTTFAPPAGSPAIHIYVYPGTGPGTDNPPLDVHCHPLRIHGVNGRRCRALASGTPVTILVDGGRTYRISSDAGIDLAIYNRFAGSFRLIHKRR